MSDLGWNGDAVLTGAESWEQVRRHISGYVAHCQSNAASEKLYSGEILSTDELTISVLKQVAEQDGIRDDFNTLLGALVGLNGDSVLNANALNDSVESGATTLGGAWGKH